MSDVTNLISDGTHFTPKYINDWIKFLSVKDVRKFEIDYNNSKFISNNEANNLDRRCKPEKNDILLTKIWATYWYASMINTDERFQIFVSLALLKPNSEIILPRYLELFLNSNIAYLQFSRLIKWAAVPDLHLEDIRTVRIPLPSISTQQKIIDKFYYSLENKRNKELKASELLKNINNFIMEQLWISYIKEKENKIYSINFDDLSNSTSFHPFNNNPKFTQIKELLSKWKYNLEKIWNFCDLNVSTLKPNTLSFINYVDLSGINSKEWVIDSVRKLNIDEIPSRAKQIIWKWDLLISSLAWSLKWIALVEEDNENLIASTGFIVIKSSKKYNNKYLQLLFRTPIFQDILLSNTTWAIMSNISSSEFKNIEVPLPPIEIQNQIAGEIEKLFNDAQNLKKEAEKSFIDAKKEVEVLILSD